MRFLLSAITLISFVFNINVYANTDTFPDVIEKANRLDLDITNSWQGKSDKFILYIEDAHCNYLAQKEISKIIETMVSSGRFDLVSVEGSSGEILTHLFSSFPVENTRKKIAENLLKSGFISGEEYFSIYNGNPLRIVGNDDEVLYRQNVLAFRNNFDSNPKVGEILEDLKYGFFCIEEEYYNKPLFEFAKTYFSYNEGTVDLKQFLNILSTPDVEGFISKYDQLQKLSSFIKKQNEFDYKLLDNHAGQIVDYLIKNTDKQTARKVKNLVFKNLSGKIKQKHYYAELLKVSDGIVDEDLCRQLLLFRDLSDGMDDIDVSELNKQIVLLTKDCFGKLIKTDQERAVYRLAESYLEFTKVLNLNLTRSEYSKLRKGNNCVARFKSFIEKYNDYSVVESIKDEDEQFLTDILENNLNFYDIASKRDKVILENTLKILDKENLKNVVIIAGGFHSDKIFKDCKTRDISCVVVRPKIAGKNDLSKYASVVLRSDMYDRIFGVTPDKLRATSFFSENSFDDLAKISAFRSEFIFSSVIDSIKSFEYKEIHDIIKEWRDGFSKAARMRNPEDSVAYRNAMELFDYMITDVFSYGNIQIDADSKSIVVSSTGVTVRLKKNLDLSVSVEQIKEPSKLEQGLALKEAPVVLQKTQVFISAWTIADETSEYFRHGDAHYSVKYIEAMNKRGIEPIIILPSDSDEKARTLEKYAPAVRGRGYRFKFAEFDANGQIMEIDLDGETIGEIDVDKTKKPTVIQLCSKIDPKNSQRIDDLVVGLSNLIGVEPFFIRVPTAGTLLESALDFDALDLYFNPLPSGFTQRFAVETGFIVDEEIIKLVTNMKNRTQSGNKDLILSQLSRMSNDRLIEDLTKLPKFGRNEQSGSRWSFRYLTEKDDAELASFMKASKSSLESQIIFTFYSDKKDVDLKHKDFLKKHFAFVDLQQKGNNALNKKSNVLIINLPPLDSNLFKGLMAVCDTAVVSGENSLVEGLILNKLGIGPTILFRPAMKEHMSILSNSLLSQGRDGVFDKVKEYADIKADPDTDYLSDRALVGDLSSSEQYISDVIFDPQMKELITSAFVGIVPPINGLNMMVDLIGKIDEGVSKDELVKLYNFKTQNNAEELVETFLLNTSVDFDSRQGQNKFVKEDFNGFVTNFVTNLVELKVSSIDIRNLIGEFSAQIVSVYDLKLTELGVDRKADLIFTISRTINEFLSEMVITDNGHVFIPKVVHGQNAYEHTYLHQRVLEGATSKPSVVSETLFEADATRLINDYNDLKYSRRFLKIFKCYPQNIFDHSDISFQVPTLSYRSDQLEILNDRIAILILPRLREIAYEFSGNLIDVYGVATVETLLDYIVGHNIHKKLQDELSEYQDKWLRYHIDTFLEHIYEYSDDDAVTDFFREALHWQDSLESYFSDLISQKVLFGDFSIAIKSVGSSFGKEAYSIATILDQTLRDYADANIYGHMEEGDAKTDLINRWIDQWDIKIYLLDKSLQRHAIAQEGAFILENRDTQNLSEKSMLQNMSRILDSEFIVVKDALRKWIHPIPVDFNSESFTLENIESEVTFAMNVLPYIDEEYRANMISEMRHSFNPRYKSFLAYNIEFSRPPIQHNIISNFDRQRHILSPAQLPTCANIFLSLLNQDFESRKEVIDFFGISYEGFDQIMDSADFSDAHLFAPMLEKMLDDFFADKIDRIDSELTANILIEIKLTDFAWSMMQSLSRLGMATDLVNEMLVALSDQFVELYEAKLIGSRVTNTKYLVDSFKTNLGKFVDGVETVGEEHLFVPMISEYTDLYQHRFIRRQVLLPDTGDITIEKVSKNVKDELVRDLRNLEYIIALIPDMDRVTAFPNGEFTDVLLDNNEPQYQNNLLRKYFASVYLGQFGELAKKYSGDLETKHGLSGLKGLSKQLLSTYPKFRKNNTDGFERWEIRLCEDHRTLIKTIYLADVDATSAGTTWFFRNEETWRPALEAYLDDIITRKELKGDLSLSVRSLGASTGREAYSIASVIEQRLIFFAEKSMFDNITNQVVKDKLVNEWVDSWRIKIYAFDSIPQRLAVGVEAVYEYIYEIRSNLETFFDENPQFKGMLEDVSGFAKTALKTFKVKDRLRRWYVPVYCDMDKNVSMLEDYPSEITFAMNMFKYTDSFNKIKQAVFKTSKNDMKSFFAFNINFNSPLVRHGEFADQPAVIPLFVLPSKEEIILTILSSRIILEDELCSYFGILPGELSSILQVDPFDFVYSLQVSRFILGREINKFLDHVSPDLDTFEKQADVIDRYFLDLTASVVEVFSGYGLDAQYVDKYMVNLLNEVVDIYYSRIYKADVHNVYELVKNFHNRLVEYMESTTITDGGHIFVPDRFDGHDIYKHLYVDRDISPGKYGVYPIVSEYVSTETKTRMLQKSVDIAFAFKIVEKLDTMTLPFGSSKLKQYASTRKPDIHIAEASIEFLSMLVARFEGLLIDFGGKADIETLYMYLKLYIDNGYKSNDESVSSEVRYALHEMFRAIKFSNFKTTGTTYFFRQVEDWIDIKDYFADVIEQKIINGDYAFIIRSVGSSTGREAYSLALILERTLRRHAETLYADEQDIMLKYDHIEQWIDLWDIKVYAYDNSFDRLKETSEGIYNGGDWGLRHFSEFNKGLVDPLYRNNPANTSFVREVFNGSENKTDGIVTVRMNPRLRRWIMPVYCNLDFDAEILNNYKAEVTFCLNTIPYLSYPKDEFIKILKESSNPKYKAFCVYNTEYDVAPEDHNVVEGRPQVICVKESPAVSKIISALFNLEIGSREDLAGYFGLDQNLQAEILVEYDLNPDEISIPQIDSIIDRYQKMSYFTDIKMHDLFIRDVLRPFIQKTVMRFALSEIDSQITKKALDVVGKKLISRYSDKVRELGIDASVANNFGKRIEDFLSVIDVAGTGHLFMPIIVAGDLMYEHTYLDRHAFVPPEERLSDLPEVGTEIVSKEKKQMLVSDFEDTKYALKILNMHEGIVGLFASYKSHYKRDKRYLKVMEDRLALAFLEPLRGMVKEYKSLLEDKYGLADMYTLWQHIDLVKEKKTFEIKADEKFKFSYIKTMNLIGQLSGNISLTAFFRKKTHWKADLEHYLKDLVFQKVLAGDRTISVKSVGSSEGREAYSMALLIENALVDYAENYLYEKESDAKKKSNLVQKWVDSWDVTLYAMDINPSSLAYCKEGIYRFSYTERVDFPTHLEPIFEKKILSKDGRRVYARVKRRFREWLKPVQCDLKRNLNVLFEYKTDITMAMNVYPYLEDTITPIRFEFVLKNSTTSDYKIFISWNDETSKIPNGMMVFDSQPLVLPVKTIDDARILSVIDEIAKRGMFHINIPELLGLMPGQLEYIVDRSEFDMQERIDEYHLTRDLADSMI